MTQRLETEMDLSTRNFEVSYGDILYKDNKKQANKKSFRRKVQ